jgi:hypothetical protein
VLAAACAPPYLIVNITLLEVSLGVLLPPPKAPPGVLLPGLVTETCAVPAVAMSAAGIVTLSVFAVGWVVLGCGTAFQFTTAFPSKLLPMIIKVNSEPP